MVLTGRIFDIIIVYEKVAQIVVRKKYGDKIFPVAVTVFGYWKDKALNEMKLKPKDKIKGNIYPKSRLYNGKYFTDISFKEIYLVESAPMDLFHNPDVDLEDDETLDTDTGEIIKKPTNE